MRKSKDRKREAQEISRKLAERAILDRKNMKYPNRNIPNNSNNGFWFEGIFIARDKGNELNYNNYRNDLSTSGSNSSGNSSSTSEWGREWSRQNMLDSTTSTTSSDDLLSERLVGTSPGRSSTIGSRKGLWIDGVYVEKEMLMQQQEEVSESSQEVSSIYSGDNDSSGSDTTAAADSDSSSTTNNSNDITQQ